jgi:hypothetical protein
MTAPVRLQLQRKAGFRLQAHSLGLNGLPASNVGRSGIASGLFGNPFKVTATTDAVSAVASYRRFLTRWSDAEIMRGIRFEDGQAAPMQGLVFIVMRNQVRANLHHLRGRNLACHCRPDAPCHADVLLALLATGKPDLWRARYPKIADRVALPPCEALD